MDKGEGAIGTHSVAPFSRTVRGQPLAEDPWGGTSVEVVLDPCVRILASKRSIFLSCLCARAFNSTR